MKFKSKTGRRVTISPTTVISYYDDGGGFVHTMPAIDFFEEFSPSSNEPRPYRVARFALDGVEETFWGYTDGERWNGWACPRFEMGQVEKLSKAISAWATAEFSPQEHAWRIKIEDGEELSEVFPETTLMVDGQPVSVFAVGAWSWCWVEAEGETE